MPNDLQTALEAVRDTVQAALAKNAVDKLTPCDLLEVLREVRLIVTAALADEEED